MIGFHENEETIVIFFVPPPPQKVRKGTLPSFYKAALFKMSQSDRAYFAMDIIP